MTEQILRLAEVLAMTGLSRSSLYRRINSGDFPAPIRLGGADSRAVGWRRSEVEAWIKSRPRSDEPPQGPAGGSPTMTSETCEDQATATRTQRSNIRAHEYL